MKNLDCQIKPAQSLSEDKTKEMFGLYLRYYDGTSWEIFARDLAAKDLVLLFHDPDGVLMGFTTVAIWTTEHESRAVRIIYSGDTIFESQIWGQTALASNWSRLSGAVKALAPDLSLYWLLLVKGHRTYRFLPSAFLEYFPSHQQPTPSWEKGLMDHLAQTKFGDCYDPELGIVHFPSSQGHLRGNWGEVGEKDRGRPEVKFFLQANPGYLEGNELVCLAEIRLDNCRPFYARLFKSGLEDRDMIERVGAAL